MLVVFGLAILNCVDFVFAGDVKPMSNEAMVNAYIGSVYKSLDFHNVDRLSFETFSVAYKGYLNLRAAGKLELDKEILTICDFNLPSTEPRMWVIDLAQRKILFNTYVAHGPGSGDDCAQAFSNTNESHQSSLGFYTTAETYNGDHGFSLRLEGMDIGFNDAARDRNIVVHGADYVSTQFICGNQRLGRSWGCPAIPDNLKEPIINKIQDGTCLFIYQQDNYYVKNSYWLNRKLEHLPVQTQFASFTAPQKEKVHKLVIEYKHGTTLDSTREVLLPILPAKP